MRFECKQNTFCSYIEDNRTGLTYIVTNYNDMKDLVTLLNKQSQQLDDKDKEIERQDKTIREINKSKYDKLMEKDILFHLKNKNEELEAKLAESEDKIMVTNYLRKNSDEVLLNYKTEKYGLDKTIQELRKMNLSLPEKEWYYKGFENCERQMSSHIADLTLEVKELKQQLVESETEIKSLSSEISSLEQDLTHYKGEVYNLKDQLAESEKLKDDALYNYAWLNQEVSDVKQKLKDSEDTYKTLCYNYQNLGKAYNELEQQLAEKDKEINDSKIMLNARGITIAGLLNDKNKLKQQLDEKEKEIEDIKNTHIYRFYLDKYKVQDVYMTDLMLEVFNQDKISFCIKKLEKVKELLWDSINDETPCGDVIGVREEIDNQIKQLKEGKYESIKFV